MKILHTSVVVVGLIGAGVLAWWWQNRAPVQAATVATGNPTGNSASGPGGQSAGPSGPVPVEVGRVEAMRLEDDTQAVGTVRSRQGVMLRPEVSGRIAKLTFSDGQRVRRSRLLVQLDDSLQRAQLQQAEAQASIARTNLQRNQDLLAQNFISKSAVDQSGSNLEVAEAQVALAKAQLARMQIVDPFDGVVGLRMVNVGDYVKDGADLVNIEDLSSVWVDFRLPERFIARLKPGQAVQVTLDALPGRKYTGRIEALDSQLDANGRSVLVRAKLANAGGELRAGMYARSRVVFDVRENALVVPEEALVPLGDKQYIFKVIDEGGKKMARRVEARIGQRVPGKVEVLEGMTAGDVVIVAGQSRLGGGASVPVRVIDLTRPAGDRNGAPKPGSAASSGIARTNASVL
ncbi:MAG TPA: efflux RND transporter periplasmic adaptor subunit [Burkholderiaceae bacterium]|nr:efflux RND transporter periplasmic adaptor subunit [Burkholderiaceae bacterium]